MHCRLLPFHAPPSQTARFIRPSGCPSASQSMSWKIGAAEKARPDSAPAGSPSGRRSKAFPTLQLPDLDGAMQRNDQLKAKCTEMKRALLLRQTRYGTSQAEYHKRQEILKYRYRLNVLLGGDVAETSGLADAEPASGDEVVQLSGILNKKMALVFADPQKRSWYNLFLHLDTDRTGLIQYAELVEFIRNELRVPPTEVPLEMLQRAWKSLDSNASGYLTTGEFGAFMRLAPFKPAETWKQRLLREKRRTKQARRVPPLAAVVRR